MEIELIRWRRIWYGKHSQDICSKTVNIITNIENKINDMDKDKHKYKDDEENLEVEVW
jgi:hypothetical protein